jgi:hypothetical protein
MILILGDPREWEAMSPEQQRAHDAAHAAFRDAAGAGLVGGEELELTPVTTLRVAPAGGVLRTDGPFQETKELVGGYYVVEAADVEEVVALAQRLPEVHASHSGVEIRPIVDHG